MSDFIVKISIKSFRDLIMTEKRFRLSAPVSWGDFRVVPYEFYSFPSFILQKSSFWAIFHICQSAQNGGLGDFGDPGLTKFIKNRVPPFCGFELHMSPTNCDRYGSGKYSYVGAVNRGLPGSNIAA